LNIIEALTDKALLGQFIEDPQTWRAWFTFLRSFFGLPPVDGDMDVYRECTGRSEWPQEAAKEATVIAGRRSGKSYITALLAAFLAVFREYHLSAGETGYVIIVSPTRQQSGIIKKYLSGFFRENAFLSPLLIRETREEIELSNRVTILILSADFRSLRGYTAVAGIVDEVAFLMDEGARPDFEVIRALRPALATTGGPLICISSPYAKRGALYSAWKAHFAKDGDPIIVWQSPSVLMNPTLATEAIERAREEDPEAAGAEWDAQFRADIESFVSQEAVDACVVPGRFELPPVSHLWYTAFVDPSGGSADSFTLAIGHEEKGVRILDCIRERKPPFSPEAVVEEYVALLKEYGVRTVTGDRYAGEWPREAFRKHWIDYVPAEKTKSDLYLELLPLINSGKVELLDNDRLINQLCRLERRTARSGKDSVDHPPHGHDDLINAAAGDLILSRELVELDFDSMAVDTGFRSIGTQLEPPL
jgi:hypothetical protein